ncbi:MAG: hypothetical protein CMN87_18260 [Stappia sp.]|uniref:hypothetical protein n=1 Tax=Stappia sp. TaxID=1870903 RepID=UPI000C5E27C3|nr:hypothetical protein [Stappia sp.]MAA97417.1 hypothetical protein [Stappia sp.]MBM21950.1 hypothetical protein [Stappia sp.]|tara:strand:- start:540 stop:758 length:219 start_codon:yes stop_codon:yes gene_type:complete
MQTPDPIHVADHHAGVIHDLAALLLSLAEACEDEEWLRQRAGVVAMLHLMSDASLAATRALAPRPANVRAMQ